MSEKNTLRKWHVITEVIICVIAAISVVTIILPLLLVPVAFAFPIIVRQAKLLFIPIGFIMLGAIVLIAVGEGSLILGMSVLVTIIGAFGVGTGFVVRFFQTRSKKLIALSYVVGCIILIVPFMFVVDILSGVVRRPFIRMRVRSHISRNYPDIDLRMGRTNFAMGSPLVRTQVHYGEHTDIYFNITVQGREIRSDIRQLWNLKIDNQLTSLLREEFGDEFRSIFTSVSGLQSGQIFDITANAQITASITIITEDTSPEALYAKILRYHELLLQTDFTVTHYTIAFRFRNATATDKHININIPPSLINEGLPWLIQHARDNQNQRGIFFDDLINFRYVSSANY